MQIMVCKRELLLCGISNKGPKPKQCLSALTGTTKTLQQAVRIMKLIAVLLLGACIHVHATGYGQKISLSERDVPLEKVFKKIQEQTKYKFLYTSQLLEGVPKVTISVKNASLEEVLDLVFKDQKLDYEINENTIVVRPKVKARGTLSQEEVVGDPIEVRGVITDENGAPAQGVNVVVKGTNKGTTTNLRGEFVLSGVGENAVLLVSSVGYDRQEILVKNKTFVTTQLRVAVGNLDEMQVIAYGKTSKRFNTGNVNTGNVSSVKAADIETQPINNPLLALQGRVPGIFIEQMNGLPGTTLKVRIQGKNSLGKGNDPLFIIDGVPYVSQMLRSVSSIQGFTDNPTSIGSNGNPMSYINPSDIESIEVLKDADATSIFGSRAANGVILITTKKGKSGKTTVDFNAQGGLGKVGHFIDLLSREEYLEMRNEAKLNDNSVIVSSDYDINGVWDSTRYTNWQKELIGGTAKYSNAQLSVSGGNANTSFLMSGGYYRETTVFPGDFRDIKKSLHFNINHSSSNRRFHIQLDGKYLIDDNHLNGTDLTDNAIQLAPNAPKLYNDDGTLNWESNANGISTWTNPLAYLTQKFKLNISNLIANAIVGYQIMPGFDFSTSLGYTNLLKNEILTSPMTFVAPELRPSGTRYSIYGNGFIRSWVVEPQVNFKHGWGRGAFDVLVGATLLKNDSYQQQTFGTGFNSDLVLEDISSAATLSAFSSLASTYRYNALFGRLNYTLQNKYILNLTARRDGSSRFGTENQFHNFGSLGFAWLFSNEKFIQKIFPFLSFGKLRGSYGTTGNEQIGDYQFMNLYRPRNRTVPYQGVSGLAPNGLSNPYLQWEETRKFQIGAELGVFSDRVIFNTTYFHNRSSNQLQNYSLPILTGATGILINFPAIVQNYGWEFDLQTINLRNGNFNWSTRANLTIPKNKLVAYDNIEQSTQASSLVIGEPITIIKRYNFIGVDPASGVYQVLNSSGAAISNPISPGDQTVWVDPSPKFYGGIQNTIGYKRFNLEFFVQFVKQLTSDYYFGNQPGRFLSSATSGSIRGNQPKTVLDRWQKPGDINSIQKFSASYQSNLSLPFSAASNSNAKYVDGSYIRLKNVSLSCLLPKKWEQKMHLQSLRLFIQGQNILTITKYQGLDPESASTSNLPPLRVWIFGIQVSV
jgi:TonB-dependent starch-binding outer membrane protein SusC